MKGGTDKSDWQWTILIQISVRKDLLFGKKPSITNNSSLMNAIDLTFVAAQCSW
jgi:hypothetical protein